MSTRQSAALGPKPSTSCRCLLSTSKPALTAQSKQEPVDTIAPGQQKTPKPQPTRNSSRAAGMQPPIPATAASTAMASAAADARTAGCTVPSTAAELPAQVQTASQPNHAAHAWMPSLACEFQQLNIQHHPSPATAATGDASNRHAASRDSVSSMLTALNSEQLLLRAGGTASNSSSPAASIRSAYSAMAVIKNAENKAAPVIPPVADSLENGMNMSVVASAVAGSIARASASTNASADAAKREAAKQAISVDAASAQDSAPANGRTTGMLLAVFPLLPHKLRRSTWRLDDFELEKRLHKGYVSEVYKARCLLSGVDVALKVYDVRHLHAMNEVQLLREIELHSSIVHNNIVALYAAFKEKHRVVLVQEWCSGGDLHRLLRKQSSKMSELTAVQSVLQPLLSALVYLHARGITHRDIKPENLLFSDVGVLKLADFGLAIDLTREAAVTCAGTVDYMAPEVLACPLKAKPEDNKSNLRLHYNSRVDAWSLGVLAYELVAGYPPFSGADRKETAKNIMAGQIAYPSRLSENACNFLANAMAQHPADRPSVMEMTNHPWMRIHQRRTSADGEAGNGAPSLSHASTTANNNAADASSKGPFTAVAPKMAQLPRLARANTARHPLDTSNIGPLSSAMGSNGHGSHATLRNAATAAPTNLLC